MKAQRRGLAWDTRAGTRAGTHERTYRWRLRWMNRQPSATTSKLQTFIDVCMDTELLVKEGTARSAAIRQRNQLLPSSSRLLPRGCCSCYLAAVRVPTPCVLLSPSLPVQPTATLDFRLLILQYADVLACSSARPSICSLLPFLHLVKSNNIMHS